VRRIDGMCVRRSSQSTRSVSVGRGRISTARRIARASSHCSVPFPATAMQTCGERGMRRRSSLQQPRIAVGHQGATSISERTWAALGRVSTQSINAIDPRLGGTSRSQRTIV
jgi:hypothetical protein